MPSIENPAGVSTRRSASSAEVRRLRRSVGALALGEAVNKLARFAATILLARSLTLSDFGLLNVGIAIGGIVVVCSRLGLPDLGAREVAADPTATARLAGPIITAQVSVLLVLTALVAAIASVLNGLSAAFGAVAAVSMLGLVASADWVLRGQERMASLARATAAGGLTLLAGVAVVTRLDDSATAALLVFAAAEIVAAALTWHGVRWTARPRVRLRGIGSLVARSWPLWISGMIIYSYYANTDTILIAALDSQRDAGLYSAPYRLVLALNAVVIFAGQALMPIMTRAVVAKAGVGERRALLLAASLPLLGYGLICLGAVEIVGGGGLAVVFGTEYRPAGEAFALLAIAVPWYAVGFPVGYALIASGQERRFLRGAAVAGLLNLALDLVLIPTMGISGAAIATTVAFAAAACVWLREQGVLYEGRILVAVLVVATVGATAGVVAEPDSVSRVIGMATVLGGAAAFNASRRSVSSGSKRSSQDDD